MVLVSDSQKELLGLSITGVSTEMMVMKKEYNVRTFLDEIAKEIQIANSKIKAAIDLAQSAIFDLQQIEMDVEYGDFDWVVEPKRAYNKTEQMKHEIYTDIAFQQELPISHVHKVMKEKYGCSNPTVYMTRFMESDGRVAKADRCYVWVVE